MLDASIKESPLEALGWDFTERKPSYRQLCLDMSAKFMKMPDELRVRDITAGSVRLAVAFLRPWFHKMVQDDFELAKTKLCELAFSIAQWPGQWWVREHGEIWDLTKLMVQTLGEELREKQKVDAGEEVKTLQSFVDNLENMVRMYQIELAAKAKSQEESRRFRSWAPRSLYPFIPKRIAHRRSDTEETLVDVVAPQPAPKVVSFEVQEPRSMDSESETETEVELELPAYKIRESKMAQLKVVDFATPVTEAKEAPTTTHQSARPHSMIETISCLCTGLFIGAFITLSIMNGQRRTIIMLT